MRIRIFLFLAIGLLVIAAATFGRRVESPPREDDEKIERQAGPAEPPQGSYNQQLWWIPVQSVDNAPNATLLETMVYAPSGPGPFPLVTINHGKPPPGSDLRSSRPGFDIAARWFVDRGFAVAVPLRRGYGRSQGAVADMVGTCDTMDYLATANATARDIEGVIEFMKMQAFVNRSQIVVVGHSHGGLGSLAVAADMPEGIIAVISFAGGSGAWYRWGVCNGRNNLLAAMAQLGQRNKLPQLWLYAKNDPDFPPDLAQAMLNSYRSNSQGKVSFLSLPPSPANGHMLFESDGTTSWAGEVDRFLTRLNIPGYVPGP